MLNSNQAEASAELSSKRELAYAAGKGASKPATELLAPWQWLLLGTALTALSGNRFNLSPLAWVAPVPFLLHARLYSGIRARLWLLLAIQIGVGIQVAKIITTPVPWMMAPMFSIPMAFGAFLTLLLFEWLRRQQGDVRGIPLYAALGVVSEWLSYNNSELGTWGSSAVTQADNLTLLQIGALVGPTGVAFLMGAVAALSAAWIASAQPRRLLPMGVAVGCLVTSAYGYGAVRLDRPLSGPQLTVAAVVSDVALAGGQLPAAEALEQEEAKLFARTKLAAQRGAQLVVWNEGALAVVRSAESALLERAKGVARAHNVDIVVAYVVPLDGMARFENKYAWIGPDGLQETYLKHHPVPGEGSVKGNAPIAVLERPYGRAAGAICYDYDFPQLSLAHAEAGAGVVAVPSSDWRGIDPLHTLMARMRGIEGGFAVVRSVRWATSGIFDAYGRPRATLNHFEDNGRMLLGQVPITHVPTLYTRIGDALPLSCLALSLLALGSSLLRRRRNA